MKWRCATILLVLIVLVVARIALGGPQVLDPALVFTGQVDMAMGPDGTLLVLVDQETPTEPTDGLVDVAFRLQEAPPLAFSGYATVTYLRGRLALQLASGEGGWVFTVAGRAFAPPPPEYAAHDVGGIARIWGSRINQPPATVFSTLSAATCSRTAPLRANALTTVDSGPGCTTCEDGGPGHSACGIACGGETACETNCPGDSFACCSCAGGCQCCKSGLINGLAHH